MPQIPISALLLMLASMTLIPLGDAAGKVLMSDHGATPSFVAWSRFGLGTAMFLVGLVIAGRLPTAR
ncbi:MAG: hypothetical protein AAFY03_03435, partial [Pseudomonadota bacterium]